MLYGRSFISPSLALGKWNEEGVPKLLIVQLRIQRQELPVPCGKPFSAPMRLSSGSSLQRCRGSWRSIPLTGRGPRDRNRIGIALQSRLY